jgi:hypothetical protein|nr:MAG TPA: hypothetical protein [Caudoviricetes sp.]
MNKNEKLRLLMAKFADYQVIRDDFVAKIPSECAVMHTISLTKNAYSGSRIIEKTDDYIKEQTARLVEAYFQLDFYATTQKKAEEMAQAMADIILFKNRYDFVRNGFGLTSDNIEITDRTFLEGSQYVYRFGFDLQMNWRELSIRTRQLIKDIDVKTEVKNG